MSILADRIQSTIGGGFYGFGALAILGLHLLYRGICNDIYDWLGHSPASRGWFIFAGLSFQLPLVGWIIFLAGQGYFGS